MKIVIENGVVYRVSREGNQMFVLNHLDPSLEGNVRLAKEISDSEVNAKAALVRQDIQQSYYEEMRETQRRFDMGR